MRFRASVVGGLGYCALDRTRSPLRGDELRGCWEAPNDAPEASTLLSLPAATPGLPIALDPAARRPRAWIAVESDSPTLD